MKRTIDPIEHAPEIMQGVQKGVLLTTKNGDRVNSMTISWGTLGIESGASRSLQHLFASIVLARNS